MSSRFLVTTSHSLLLVDLDREVFTPVHRGRGLYYGITGNGREIFVAARGRMVSSDQPGDEERGQILVFDGDLQLVRTIAPEFALRDMHEIAWHGNKLWVTCSFDNMIALFDGSRWQRWYPAGEVEEPPYDRNHFNSFFFENRVVVVLAHNWGESTMHFFDARTLQPVRELSLGHQAHNVWTEDGEYLTCSSGRGRIVGDRGFDLETGGFPRGVARSGDVRCLGISEFVERTQRDFTSGVLKVYDPSWRHVKDMLLPQEGLVLDIFPVGDR